MGFLREQSQRDERQPSDCGGTIHGQLRSGISFWRRRWLEDGNRQTPGQEPSGRRWRAILRFWWLFVRSWTSVKQFEPTGYRVCPEMLTVTKADPCVYGIRMWVQVWVLDKRLLCVYFTTYSPSEKEGAAADRLLRVWCFCTSRPWGSRFTWEMGLHMSSSGEVPEAWGGG